MLGLLLRKKEHKIIAFVVVFVVLVVGVVLMLVNSQDEQEGISSFEECITAGYPIMESYPRQCRDGEGNVFVEEIEYPINPEI